MSAKLLSLSKLIARDERVLRIQHTHNVAQFISLNDDFSVRICVFRDRLFSTTDPKVALAFLFEHALDHRVNVRIFKPSTSTGALFFSDIASIEHVFAILTEHKIEGGYSIISETIDLNDGGVAGALYGDVVEFRQGSTPKFVDQQRHGLFPQMQKRAAERMLSVVYGSDIDFSMFNANVRVEFSTHPSGCGTQFKRFLLWDCYEVTPQRQAIPHLVWPNSFSEWMGDKCFGLLAAWSMGFLVPKTEAVLHPMSLKEDENCSRTRWTPPEGLTFGEETGEPGFWTRTCPFRPTPGKYPTYKTRCDPLDVMLRLDPNGSVIRSCLVQQDVHAQYSGAAQVSDDIVRIEGVQGEGSKLMMGTQSPEQLPTSVNQAVIKLSEELKSAFGPCRFEWAWQTNQVWLLQINQLQKQHPTITQFAEIRLGYLEFDPDLGLDELDRIISLAKRNDQDILVTKRVGLTSHVCELLNRSKLRFAIVSSP